VFIEYRTIGVDVQSLVHARRMEQAGLTLLLASGEHGVTWLGELPPDPDDDWYCRIQETSVRCSRTGAWCPLCPMLVTRERWLDNHDAFAAVNSSDG
jgi:hypothetical protein